MLSILRHENSKFCFPSQRERLEDWCFSHGLGGTVVSSFGTHCAFGTLCAFGKQHGSNPCWDLYVFICMFFLCICWFFSGHSRFLPQSRNILHRWPDDFKLSTRVTKTVPDCDAQLQTGNLSAAAKMVRIPSPQPPPPAPLERPRDVPMPVERHSFCHSDLFMYTVTVTQLQLLSHTSISKNCS